MPNLRAIPGSFAGVAGRMKPVPGQWTTDKSVMPDAAALRALADITAVKAMTPVERAAALVRRDVAAAGEDEYGSDRLRLIEEIRTRKMMLEPEQARLRTLFQRWDNLYYPDQVTLGGADHWPEERPLPGRAHVSVNVPPVYVEIPAALQAVVPVENYVPATLDDDERAAAARRERLYFQWKDEIEFELRVAQACLVKSLYGFTYAKVYWDPIEKRPTVSIIDRPENLYVGWGDSDFSRMDWAIYCYGLSPIAVEQEFGLVVERYEVGDGLYIPYVTTGDHSDPIGNVYSQPDVRLARSRSGYEKLQVEVYDYWYKKARGKGKKAEVWNCIYVGNQMVKNTRHPEYDDIPYVPLLNTFIPGLPYGKSELYDIEQLIREKDERLTQAAQMIQSVVGGQMWQLVGPEAPEEVPANAIPKPNKVATPGAGNELRAIQPFIPQFAIEDFLKRLDQEMEVVSGLNELLLGRAPATILGSSKAIAALVANYESRIQMKRQLLYQWRKRVWRMAAMVWERKDRDVREIIDGNYRLEIKPPELTPRDELENAQKAINLLQNRAWSLRRVMDATGVEDPEEEIGLIRDEQTDPALNPAAVQAQATLLSALQSLGITPPQASVNQAQAAARTLNRPAGGTSSLNGPENAANPPQETAPGNAAPPNSPGSAVAQTLLQGGEASGRVLTQTPLTGGGQ